MKVDSIRCTYRPTETCYLYEGELGRAPTRSPTIPKVCTKPVVILSR